MASPKDASLRHPELKSHYLKEMKQLKEEGVGPSKHRVSVEVAQLIALVRATTSVLCVKTGAEVLDILAKR